MMGMFTSTGRPRRAARAGLVVLTLAASGTIGVSSASASGGGCNSGDPAICFSVNGSGVYVNWMEVNLHVPEEGPAYEYITDPNGNTIDSSYELMTGPAWMGALRLNLDKNMTPGWYCGKGWSGYNEVPVPDRCVDVT